jgi:4-hydroxybenzoate polyprenyltransferase
MTAQRRMRHAVAMARAAHIGPSLAVTAFTSALALRSGRRRRGASVTAAVLCGQLCVGWSNDYLDRDRDRVAGRTDKPIAVGAVAARSVGVAALVAGAVSVPLSYRSGRRAGSVHLAAIAAALAYNAGLKSTVWSVVPYAAAFGAVPAFVSLAGTDGRPPGGAETVAAALMGAGAHFVNTLPDRDVDAATGVQGLPQRMGRAAATVTGVALLGAAVAVVATTGDEPVGPLGHALTTASAGSVVAVLAAAATGRQRIAWTWSLATAAATVALYLERTDPT